MLDRITLAAVLKIDSKEERAEQGTEGCCSNQVSRGDILDEHRSRSRSEKWSISEYFSKI